MSLTQEKKNIRASTEERSSVQIIDPTPRKTDPLVLHSDTDGHDTVTEITSQGEDVEEDITDQLQPSGDPTTEDVPKEITIDMLESKAKQKEIKRLRREMRKDFQRKAEAERLERENRNKSQTTQHKNKMLSSSISRTNQELKDFSSSISTEDIESPQQSTHSLLSLRDVFLDDFDDLPSLSDLSSADSEEQINKTDVVTEQSNTEAEQAGIYVDPLTGIKQSSSSDSVTLKLETKSFYEAEEQSIESTTEDECSGLSDLDSTDKTESKHDLKPVFQELDILEQLVKIETASDDDRRESKTAEEALNLARELRTMAAEFVHDLIDRVVTYVETCNPDEKLAQKLDKSKLLTQLKDTVFQFFSLKCDNKFLNRKILDHYKTSKAKRYYQPLPNKIEVIESARYRNALYRLDNSLNVMKQAKYKNACLTSSVQMDLQHIQNIALSTEEQLEETIKITVNRRNSEAMKRFIDRELRQIKILRNEISDTRLFLITRKHTLALLSYKMEKIEEITPELSMSTFISMQTEVQTIHKKFEERSSDLEKACHRYNQLIHQQSQSLEKSRIIASSLRKAKVDFKEKLQLKRDLRDRLYKLKMEHIGIRQQKRDLVMQGGLLTNVLLMFDYDKAVEDVALKKQKVAELKISIKLLENKIADSERKLTRIIEENS